MIEALLGTFGLDIYRESLDSLELTDEVLIILLSRVNPACLILLEDIDRASLSIRRIEGYVRKETGIPLEGHAQPIQSIILSGFLDAIDGIATREGPIVIFTTNCLNDLDPAIVRPGRVDKEVRLGLASRPDTVYLYQDVFVEAHCKL